MEPESAEDFYARVQAATGPDGRLEVAVEEMPGWDIYPFEIDSLRMKPLRPLADEEPPRGGENPAECYCAGPPSPDLDQRLVWSNERWQLHLDTGMKLPIGLNLGPREHCDLPTVPHHLAGGMGRLLVAVSAGVESLPASAASRSPSTATAVRTSTCSSSADPPGCSSSAARRSSTGRRTSRRSRSRFIAPTRSTSRSTCSPPSEGPARAGSELYKRSCTTCRDGTTLIG